MIVRNDNEQLIQIEVTLENNQTSLTAFFGLLSFSSSESSSESLSSSLSDISYVCIGDNGFSSTFFKETILFAGSMMCFNAVDFTAECWLDFMWGLLCFKDDKDDDKVEMAAVVEVDLIVCDDGAIGEANFAMIEVAEDTIPDLSLDTNTPTLLLDESDLVADSTAALPILA